MTKIILYRSFFSGDIIVSKLCRKLQNLGKICVSESIRNILWKECEKRVYTITCVILFVYEYEIEKLILLGSLCTVGVGYLGMIKIVTGWSYCYNYRFGVYIVDQIFMG